MKIIIETSLMIRDYSYKKQAARKVISKDKKR